MPRTPPPKIAQRYVPDAVGHMKKYLGRKKALYFCRYSGSEEEREKGKPLTSQQHARRRTISSLPSH